MYAGQIVEKGPTKELIKKPVMPYTEALIKSAPNLDALPHSKLNIIPGMPPNVLNPPEGCSFYQRCSYAEDQCKSEMPLIKAKGCGEHTYRCWYPL